MKQFLLEILTTELENDYVEPFDYLKIRKEILNKTDQELKPVVEEIVNEAYVNEDITLEDFEEIMNELNEVEEQDDNNDKVDECSCKREDFNLDEILDSILDEDDEVNEQGGTWAAPTAKDMLVGKARTMIQNRPMLKAVGASIKRGGAKPDWWGHIGTAMKQKAIG